MHVNGWATLRETHKLKAAVAHAVFNRNFCSLSQVKFMKGKVENMINGLEAI